MDLSAVSMMESLSMFPPQSQVPSVISQTVTVRHWSIFHFQAQAMNNTSFLLLALREALLFSTQMVIVVTCWWFYLLILVCLLRSVSFFIRNTENSVLESSFLCHHPDLFALAQHLIIAPLQFGSRPVLWGFHAQQNHRIAMNRGSRIELSV